MKTPWFFGYREVVAALAFFKGAALAGVISTGIYNGIAF